MSLTEEDSRLARTTLAIYTSGLGFLIVLVIWAARFVLFQPWTAREWVAGVADGRALYLFGGRSRTGVAAAEVYRIDIEARRIRRMAALPSPRFGTAVARTPAGITVLGGFDGTHVLDEILVLESRRGRLKAVGRLPTPRAFAAAAAVGDTVYCIGGWTGGSIVSDILAVDPASGSATVVGHLPVAREQLAAAASGGRIYVVGGSDPDGTYLDEILEISPQGSVLRTARLPSGRTRAAALSTPAGILVLGGWVGGGTTEAFLVDPRGEKLEVVPLPALPRALSSVAVAGGAQELVIAGGADEQFVRQIGLWAWNPQTGEAHTIKLRSFLGW